MPVSEMVLKTLFLKELQNKILYIFQLVRNLGSKCRVSNDTASLEQRSLLKGTTVGAGA